MEAPAYPKPTQDKTPKDWMMALTMFLPLTLPSALGSPHNPHAPQKLTWQVSSANGDVIWSTTHTALPWTWWPSLYPDLCLLAAGLDSWDVPEIDPTSPPKPESRGQYPGAGMGSSEDMCAVIPSTGRSSAPRVCMPAPEMEGPGQRSAGAEGQIVFSSKNGVVKRLGIPIGSPLLGI